LQHTKADTGQSGIGQIHNPVARIPLQVLDAIGSTFLPALTMGLPGTQLHHQLLVNQARGDANQEQATQTAAAQREHLGAQTKEAEAGIPLKEAQTEEAKATAEARAHPKVQWKQSTEPEVDPQHPELGPQAVFYNEQDPTQKHYGNAPVAAKPTAPKEPKEGELPLGERVPQLKSAMQARYQVLHPGQNLPAHYDLPANATQKDFDRIDKLMEQEEHAAGTKTQQEQLAEMRRQTQAIAAANREQKQETGTRAAAFKAYTPAMDSAERFNVMAKNYEDAVKNHDQQAMLSLLANHLGMTMGLQKGARMTKDIIAEAQQSRPWLQGLAAKFDKNGYLSGVTLTPEQMRQMVHLGRERFSEDLTKGRSEAKYLGANDEGPERTPNRSTINFYLGLSQGNAAKAKELAAKDGWSVK
jgi:hypothetical protein